MSEVSLIIDGIETSVAQGKTILEAARELGIDIPTFCYDPSLATNGACRICVVEVEKARTLVASCVTPVSPGMIIHTESERVVNARKTILSLLVASHPLVCITCEKTGACKLQDYCYRYGIAGSEFSGEVKELPLDDSNIYFIRDMNKCILCGICVGKCQDTVGAGAIDFTKRGFISNVGPAFEDAIEKSSCVFCGLCIDSCPVGALTPKAAVGRGRSWQVETVRAVCPYCGVGCSINLHTKGGKVVAVDPDFSSPVNRGQLCVRGKFGWDFIISGDRLTEPLVKSDGVFIAVSWEEALGLAVDNIEDIKRRYGADAIFGASSPKVSNEEAYLLHKLIRSIGSNNIDSLTRHCHSPAVKGLMETLGSAAQTNSIDEICFTGAILVVGANPSESHPVLSYRIREAVLRNGARLIVIGSEEIDLIDIAHHHLPIKPGSEEVLVNALSRVIVEEGFLDREFIEKRTEGFAAFKESLTAGTLKIALELTGAEEEEIRQVARTYAGAEKAAIIAATASNQGSGGANFVHALVNVALLTGNLGRESTGLYLPYGENNLQGVADMGTLPAHLSGYQPLSDKKNRDKFHQAWGVALNDKPGLSAAELFKGQGGDKVRALYLLGENPMTCSADRDQVKSVLSGLDLLIVQDIFMTETAALADIILPAASFAEVTGSYTNTERRVQLSEAAVKPPGDARPGWEIITDMASGLGFDWDYGGPEDVFREIALLTPQYSGISYERLMLRGLQWPCPKGDHPGSRFLHEGRFIRGLGRFTALDPEEDLKKSDATVRPDSFTDNLKACSCHSDTLKRHSTIDALAR